MLKNKITKVKKRDGSIDEFDQTRISDAIFKALTSTGQGDGKRVKKLSDRVVQILNRRFKKDEIPRVEQIQDIVEEVLILEGLVETAKAYILYREQRRRIREAAAVVDESTEMIDRYIQELDWQVYENANMTFSLQGLNQYAIKEASKKYWLNKIYPKEIREAAQNEDFHIHNLETLAPYCAGWDLYDLLLRGFSGVPSKIESRPPKHFRTALGQLVNFLFTLQGETAGANAVTNFDTLLAPFIRYDNLSYPNVKQAMQEFLYNCMVPTRVGFQTPFLNVSLDIKVPEFYKNQPVIIGGKFQKETYGEFQEEMNMFIRAFYEGLMEGDAKNRPFTFPIPTVSITKDFNWDDPALDPLWEATAKYGVNYFSNFIQSDMKPDDARSMCLDAKEEILIRNSKNIKRLSIKEVAESYKLKDFDKEGWTECKKEGSLEVLSLNPRTLKLEWSPVKRFLKIVNTKAIEIIGEDGKRTIFSLRHPMAIYTPEGIKMKFAEDIREGDFLLTLRRADDVLSKEYQKIDNIILNEDLGKILGYFVAKGNYLFENRKGYFHFEEPRGLQFTFKAGDKKSLNLIKNLIKKIFDSRCKESQDPRYNIYYLYVYNSEIARKLYNAGFKKYGRLPQVLFNSPPNVIKNFLDYHFKGVDYKKRGEVHVNDRELSRDLVLLYSLVNRPTTYKLKRRSQLIRLQHSKAKTKMNNGWLNNPILAERMPTWMGFSTFKVSGPTKARMVEFDVLTKYNVRTNKSLKITNSDIYISRVKGIRKKNYKKLKEFYDIELEKNHLFVHSLGQISFNCCRLRLDNRELYKRGGGLFGSNPSTGSIGVVTINLPRIGYLSKTKKDFFERLSHLMDLAKESLEIKRKTLESFIEKGLYPYSRHYLAPVKKIRGFYFGNHFATIGLIGMNEALLNFIGETTASKRGRRFALELLDFMRDRLVKYQKETDNLYNLEATPGEGSLAPDEKVLISQSDPKLTEIGPLVDKYIQENIKKVQILGNSEILKLSAGEMFTYGFSRNSLKIKKYPVTALVRHEGRSMYEIKTASGRKVKVTGQHSIFTFSEEGQVKEILVSDLKEGAYVAIPKKIEMEQIHKEFNLIEVFRNTSLGEKLYCIFPIEFVEKLVNNPVVKNWSVLNYKNEWKDIKHQWRRSKVVPLRLIYELGLKIDRQTLKSSKIFYRAIKNTKPINVLIPINEDLGFIIGSLLSEGWLSEKSEFTNTNEEFIKRFVLATKKVFGKEAIYLSFRDRREKGRKIRYTITLSEIIGYFFQAIGFKGKNGKKKIPPFLFFSSLDCLSGLLRGFHLGNGSIYKNKEKNDLLVKLSTDSKELTEGLNLCLLKFGILTKINLDKKSETNPLWKNNYTLSVTGADNLKRYFELVLKKKIRLNNFHSEREIISGGLPKSIKAIMKKYSIKPTDIGISKDSFNRNVRKNRISLQFFKKIVKKLSNLVKDSALQKFKIFANSDLYWDRVVEVKKIATPKYVYDLEVEVEGDLVNNFLGGEGLLCLHNTAYRQAKIDKERYPDIITAGTKEVPYYTNSSHLPVNFTDDVFEALELQDELQCRYTGGTVLHLFLGERISDSQMAKNLVKKVFENFHLPYITLTPTFSICPSHGYLEGEHFECPKCTIKQPCEVYSRIVGYLRPVQQWNLGKKEEFRWRREYRVYQKEKIINLPKERIPAKK